MVEKFQAQKFCDSSAISSNENRYISSSSNGAQEGPLTIPKTVETLAPTTSGSSTNGLGCEAIFSKTVVPSSATATAAPISCHNPAVWQGVKIKKGTVNMFAKSAFTKSLG